MTTYRNVTIRITGRAVATLLAAAALVWLVTGFNKVLFILFLAMLLAVGIDPLVDRMERRRVPRAVGILIVYLVLLGVLVAAIALLVPVLVDESSQLATSLPRMVAQAAELPQQWHIPGLERLSGPELAQRVGNEIGGVVASVPRLVVGIGKAVTGVLVSALLVLVVAFFLSSDAHFAPRRRRSPTSTRPRSCRARSAAGWGTGCGRSSWWGSSSAPSSGWGWRCWGCRSRSRWAWRARCWS